MNNGLSLSESFSLVGLGERLVESFRTSAEAFVGGILVFPACFFTGDSGTHGIDPVDNARDKMQRYKEEAAQNIRTALAQTGQEALPDPA